MCSGIKSNKMKYNELPWAASCDFSSQRTRSDMVLETFVSSDFNHLTQLAIGESFIEFGCHESFKSCKMKYM
jgi:hypothetical protein